MAVTTVEVVILTIMAIIFIFAVISLALSYRTRTQLASDVTTKGMNGIAGSILNLQCPSGQVISFSNSNPTVTRGALFCSGDSSCDGFAGTQTIPNNQSKTFFSPATTVDVFGPGSQFSSLAGICQGQSSCSWTIPTQGDARLAGSCISKCKGSVQFVGTYDCIPS